MFCVLIEPDKAKRRYPERDMIKSEDASKTHGYTKKLTKVVVKSKIYPQVLNCHHNWSNHHPAVLFAHLEVPLELELNLARTVISQYFFSHLSSTTFSYVYESVFQYQKRGSFTHCVAEESSFSLLFIPMLSLSDF